MKKKKCRVCEEFLSETDFYKKHKDRDVLLSECKECSGKRKKNWEQSPRGKRKEYNKKQYDT